MKLKKGDIVIFAVIAAFLVIWLIAAPLINNNSDEAEFIRITKDGKDVALLPMTPGESYTVSEGEKINRIEIHEDGCIMSKANCPDGLCLRQGPITKKGQTIVCLPHRIVVEGVGKGTSDLDAVTN